MKEAAEKIIALSAGEAVKLIKPKISTRVLINAAKAGQIPARQIGRRYFFSMEAIRHWMNWPGEDDGRNGGYPSRPALISASPGWRRGVRRGRGLLPR